MGNSASFTSPASPIVTTQGPTTPQNVFNPLDQIGLLVGLSRLKSERNAEYKQRILQVFARRANSTYLGLINGITRELGLSLFDAITITPRTSSGVFVAANPGVTISEAFVYLYKDIRDPVNGLDMKIDRYDPLGVAFILNDLITQINTSTYFSASLTSGVDGYTRSMCLLNQTMDNIITGEVVPPVTRFQLKNPFVIKGTLFFSDLTNLLNEVNSLGSVLKQGDYFVDYQKGIVTSFTLPTPGATCRYQYISVPMTCIASPVIIHSLQSPDFQSKLFDQVLNDLGQPVNSLPTSLGTDIINELLSVFPGSWGP